ncbi:MAG: glycosyltransferase family 39 protein [Candidatus Binatia bacterium]
MLASENPRAWQRWSAALALALAALALYLPGIGDRDFVGDDEALDAGVVAEMYRTGDWLFPEFNGEYLPPKPPLYYWAGAVAAKLHGRADEWSSRLPSAVAGAAMVGMTVAATTPVTGLGPAALGGAMLATMPVVFGQARVARCDMLLALIVSACLFLVMPARGRPIAPAERWLFWSLLGLAAITKGAAGVGLVVIVILANAAAERDASMLRALADRAIIAFVVLGAGWYALATFHWGHRFVDEQILGENLRRLVGGEGISDKGASVKPLAERLTYYLRHLFPLALPWSVLLPAALFAACRGSAEMKGSRFFVVWLVAGLAFFTAVLRKSPYYLLPLAPPMALLCATWAFPRLRVSSDHATLEADASSRRLALAGGAAALTAVAFAALSGPECEVHAALLALHHHAGLTLLAVLLLGGGLLGGAVALRHRHWAASTVALLAGLYGCFWITGIVNGAIDSCVTLRPIAEAVRSQVGPGSPVFFFREPLPAVALYSQRRIQTLRDLSTSPPRPCYLIVPEALAAQLPAGWSDGATIAAEIRGRAFTSKPMKIQLLRLPPATELGR